MTSWRDDLTLARARLTALETAETAAVTGERVQRISYDGGSVEYSEAVKPAELARLIYETRMVIRQLGGGGPRGGGMVPVMGG